MPKLTQPIQQAGYREKLHALLVCAQVNLAGNEALELALTARYCPSRDTVFIGSHASEVANEASKTIEQLKALGYDDQGLQSATSKLGATS